MAHEVDSRWVEIDVGDKEMSAYVSAPRGHEARPAVVVVQEIFGVTRHIRSVCERLAHAGYVAVAPDVFHRQSNRFETQYTNLAPGLERMRKLREQDFLSDTDALLRWLRARPEVRRDRVGVIGFSMGGRLAFLVACSRDVQAAASFYGAGIAAGLLDRASQLRCPLLMVFGAEDMMIPPAEVEKIQAALGNQPKPFEIVVYPKASHGFFCSERESYEKESAEDAWERVMKLFSTHLRH